MVSLPEYADNRIAKSWAVEVKGWCDSAPFFSPGSSPGTWIEQVEHMTDEVKLNIRVLDDQFPYLYELTDDGGRQEVLNADVEKKVHVLVGQLMAIWRTDCKYCCLYDESCKDCPNHVNYGLGSPARAL